MTLKQLKDAAEKRGMTGQQIDKLLYPHKISVFIIEQQDAGLNKKQILSNTHYINEQTFGFEFSLKFNPMVEEFLNQSDVGTFSEFFMLKAKQKQSGAV